MFLLSRTHVCLALALNREARSYIIYSSSSRPGFILCDRVERLFSTPLSMRKLSPRETWLDQMGFKKPLYPGFSFLLKYFPSGSI
jgi:hypothetical protein